MTEQEVVDLMNSSKNDQEWNENADKVKAAFGGDYPSFWWEKVMLSGRRVKVVCIDFQQ